MLVFLFINLIIIYFFIFIYSFILWGRIHFNLEYNIFYTNVLIWIFFTIPGKTDEGTTSKIWFQFSEGYCNAIRKTIKMKDMFIQ